LLNLFLSMMAGVQAAALLIAAKRSDSISSQVALHTANNTDDIKRLIQENTTLTAQVKSNTDLLEEIHLHIANIGLKIGADMGEFPPNLAIKDRRKPPTV
jgi:predicted GTPase